MKRFCCICCNYKPITCFYVADENIDGYTYQCKECLREHMRELNKKNGYFKRYYYKQKGIQYPLSPPKVSETLSPSPKIETVSSVQPATQTSRNSSAVFNITFE